MAASSSSSMAAVFLGTSHHHHRRRLTSYTSLTFPSPSRTKFYSSCSIRCSQNTITDAVSSHRRRPNVVQILEERGLLDSLTGDALRSAASDSDLKVYCVFDPTAETLLHLGNLVGIVVMSWFLRCGHSAVALIAGTAAYNFGPSDDAANVSGISDLICKIMGRSKTYSNSFEIMNNHDWWKDFDLLEIFEDVGRLVMIMSDLEPGLSYTELFCKLVIPRYDFLHLFQNHGVNVQIGGSDQWDTISAGIDLIRIRKITIQDGGGAYGLTFPLLVKSDGTKFGKAENVALLSPYKFYQYLFSVPDADVIRFLKTLTFLSLEEIGDLERAMQTVGYIPNTVQRKLAEEVTRFVHGQEGLDEAWRATEALRPGAAETKFDWKTIEGIAGDVPSSSLSYDQVLNVSVVDLSVLSGLLESKSAARRILKQGGLYLNNSRIDSEGKKIGADDIVDGKVLLLSAGKKNKMVVRIS